MTRALGKKNRTAAKIQRLIDDVPLCAAAAIQRGPSTAAMLNSSTSQKPISRRSCARASVDGAAGGRSELVWIRASGGDSCSLQVRKISRSLLSWPSGVPERSDAADEHRTIQSKAECCLSAYVCEDPYLAPFRLAHQRRTRHKRRWLRERRPDGRN